MGFSEFLFVQNSRFFCVYHAYLLTKTYFNHIILSTEPDTPLIMMRTTSGHFFIRKYNMAETLKKHQQAMTIDEQIANLKAIGLQIDNEDYRITI